MRAFIVRLSIVLLGLCAANAYAQQTGRVVERAELRHAKGTATCVVNAPRPLQQSVQLVNEEYGWAVNYEDPLWDGADLVDDTDPAWRAAHPNERGVRRVRGGAFESQYSELPTTAHSADERSSVLGKLVSDC